MSDLFISVRAKNFGEIKKNIYIKNNFNYLESHDLMVYKIRSLKDAVKILKFNIKRNEFSDYIIYEEGNYIDEDEIKEIYLSDILERPDNFKDLIIRSNKEILNRRSKITDLINEVQYDYMLQINTWYKHSKARLYVFNNEDNDSQLGYIDLFDNKHYFINKELLQTLIEDKRIILISKFYKISEGFN